MPFLLITFGSAGDVNPMIALGTGLAARGHGVTVVTNPHFERAIRAAGLGFLPLGTLDDYRQALEDPLLWHPRKSFEVIARRGMLTALRPVYEIIARHDPQDTIVAATGLCLGARCAQEKLGFRLATIHLQPSILRSIFQHSVAPGLWLPEGTPRLLKRFVYAAVDRLVIDRVLGPGLNAFRAELGLPPARRIFDRWLHSPARVVGLFPEWFAGHQPDWPPPTRLTGFLNRESERDAEPLAPALAEFLEGPEPPIAFTPGTAMAQGRSFFEAAIGACRILRRKALLLSPHREQLPESLPSGVLQVDYAPFRTLLPRTAALVHHGGIGTLAQGLAAGIPQLVMPMAHDQPDNAARLTRLGVGTSLVPRRFRAPAVAERLDALLRSSDVRERCKETARRVDFPVWLRKTCESVENTGQRKA